MRPFVIHLLEVKIMSNNVKMQYPTSVSFEPLIDDTSIMLSYTAVIDGHEVWLSAVGTRYGRTGFGALDIHFEVDGTTDKQVLPRRTSIAVSRYLRGVWEHLQLFADCYKLRLECAVEGGLGSFRARWYSKLGFKVHIDSNKMMYRPSSFPHSMSYRCCGFDISSLM